MGKHRAGGHHYGNGSIVMIPPVPARSRPAVKPGIPGGVVTALIYIRVSTDEQAKEGLSLDTQLVECRRYVAGKDRWVIGHEYQDVLKGTRDDRPDYQELLGDARRLRAEGKPVAVVVAALDRFGRAILERVRSREELKVLGVPTHSVREGGEVSDIVANVLAAVAQEEVRRLGERVSAVRAHATGNGWKFPGRCPWGYTWRAATDEERRHGAPRLVPEIDPLAAPAAREVWTRVAAGETVRRVAAWAANLPSEVRGGRALAYSWIARMLREPAYVARPRHHPEPDVLARPVGHWPALIDDATYRRVQTQLDGHQKMPRQASGRYLLSGLIRCPACAARMSAGGNSTGCRRRRARYRCASSFLWASATSRKCARTASAAAVDADVLGEVGAVIEAVASTDGRVSSAVRQAWQALEQRPEDADRASRRLQMERAAEKARERIKRLALLYADGDLDREGYQWGRDQAQDDLEASEAELARLAAVTPAPALPPLETVLREAGGWSAILRAGSTPAKRDVLAVLIDTVIPERVGFGRYRAHITWTALGRALRAASSAGVAA
jgi:DNA invertase Pin-like site-specific DNA recombinase